ncbi:MAG: alpha-2-macroglobulin [Blastocatellia bacterium]|nr:alpha-2-macroglobulin [Blastocatellia bacterium]
MRLAAFVIALAVLAPTLFVPSALAQSPQYPALRADAERLFAEGSYSRSREIYLQAKTLTLPRDDARWVDFRLADTLWRSESATPSADTTKMEAASEVLNAFISETKRVEDRDRVWAEANESLGDFYWIRRDYRNSGAAWPFYRNALDWWAGTADIEMARSRYLRMVWRMSEPPNAQPYERYGYYGGYLEIDVLENALRIAQTDNDRARAHFLIAVTSSMSGDWNQAERAPESFETAIAPGKSVRWYDDALFRYAEFLANQGRAIYGEDGSWRRVRDLNKALELYQRIVTEFAVGESQYVDNAKAAIANITKPTVSVAVPNVFLPGSEIAYTIAWRNVTRIDVAIYRIDLTKDPVFATDQNDATTWADRFDPAGRKPVATAVRETGDTGEHGPGSAEVRVAERLDIGAYIIEARSDTTVDRDLLLITDTALVVKTSGRKALVYACNAIDGSPINGAKIVLWEATYTSSSSTWSWRRADATADRDGLASIDLTNTDSSRSIFVTMAHDDRQAFSNAYSYGSQGDSNGEWKIYAYTDRPAYRPGEDANWKLTARVRSEGLYTTPARTAVEYEIYDPRGTKVSEGKSTLNEFGSAWGSMKLTEGMPLGEYTITFWTARRARTIGSATIFRLEEYKLPEFEVTIRTPEENGKKKAFRLGERIEVDVEANYYFGGAVANATVEVLVRQNPYYRWWHTPRDFPWFYGESNLRRPYYGGGGQIVKRDTIKTDTNGRARVVFDTPRSAQQDFEYTIEARVTDASRREIVATDQVRVTRQRYFIDVQPDRFVLRPQDQAKIAINARDANDEPVAVEGQVKITRDTWTEVWLDPKGKEIRGEELRKAKEKNSVFPPSVKPNEKPWKLKSSEYVHEDISTEVVRTGADGKAEVVFTPQREGYYRIAWSSREKGGPPILAETTVWAATNETTDLGYRSGGLQVLVDRDTFRAGQTAKVMIAAPTNGRTVLFSVEGDELYSHQLIRMTGSVKIIDVVLDDRHVPNVFLTAAMVSDGQIFVDSKDVVVPPVKNFLTVDVKADREIYEPRESGTLTVTTKDIDGKPVSAEVGLGFVDASVYAIQSDYAGDPRQVYFGERRGQRVSTMSSFQTKSYRKVLLSDLEKDREAVQTATFIGGVGRSESRDGFAISGQLSAEKNVLMDAAAPAPAAEADPFYRTAKKEDMKSADDERQGGKNGQEPAVQVRSDFRATVLWQPDVVTGPDGTAVVKVAFPDSLTSWRATARAATTGNQFGISTTSARTRKPLTVRLQASVDPTLVIEGLELTGAVVKGRAAGPDHAARSVPGNGETRFDWTAEVKQSGQAKLTVSARAGRLTDAMERSLPIYEHGIDKLLVTSGKAREGDVAATIDVPSARKPGSTTMVVQVSPSLAVTMLDALPYLIRYPYGCTEQTMSRFLPAAIVSKTLTDLGIKASDVEGRVFGGVEQANAAETHSERGEGYAKLADVQAKSLERLYDFQHDDGGWGWWKEGQSDPYMTAYVVWGLTIARRSGITLKGAALDRGADFLAKNIVEAEDELDQQAWILHALSCYRAANKDQAGLEELSAFDNLYTNKDKLTAYTRALLAIAAHNYAMTEQAQVLARNLSDGAQIDLDPSASPLQALPAETAPAPAPGADTAAAPAPAPRAIATAHWGEDRGWWRWSDGSIESTSFVLQALMAIDPKNELIEPAMNWLVKNRRGAQWSNTKDTAIAILALTDYLKTSNELSSDLEYELVVNGRSIATTTITAAQAIVAPSRYVIDPKLVRSGTNDIRITRKSGTGPIYYSAEVRFFSQEEPVTAAGSELFVRRRYYRLVGYPTLLKGYVYRRIPLADGDTISSGERIETVLTIETKNDYEYLLFEDLKPAGFEAVEVRSGEPLYARELKESAVEGDRRGDEADYTGRTEWVYRELRDRKVAVFANRMPQGVWEIRYDLRAEVPGYFHALPVVGQAMYVPEIRGNGDEVRVTIVDADDDAKAVETGGGE